jgi:hypothetical protein
MICPLHFLNIHVNVVGGGSVRRNGVSCDIQEHGQVMWSVWLEQRSSQQLQEPPSLFDRLLQHWSGNHENKAPGWKGKVTKRTKAESTIQQTYPTLHVKPVDLATEGKTAFIVRGKTDHDTILQVEMIYPNAVTMLP